MSHPAIQLSNVSFKQDPISDDVRIEVYPPISADVEPENFYRRFKKSIVNALNKMVCGLMDRPYSYFTNQNTQTVQITVDFPPV
uniref:RusA family crossover junction endodeoxyribonuclease n=1 Tax=Caenorhabditis tropicalis TaxID=1561998 RepID=A0A1I7U172_9PELO